MTNNNEQSFVDEAEFSEQKTEQKGATHDQVEKSRFELACSKVEESQSKMREIIDNTAQIDKALPLIATQLDLTIQLVENQVKGFNNIYDELQADYSELINAHNEEVSELVSQLNAQLNNSAPVVNDCEVANDDAKVDLSDDDTDNDTDESNDVNTDLESIDALYDEDKTEVSAKESLFSNKQSELATPEFEVIDMNAIVTGAAEDEVSKRQTDVEGDIEDGE